MLNYSVRDTPNGLRVLFRRKRDVRAITISLLCLAAVLAIGLHLPLQTIGDRFGRLSGDLALAVALLVSIGVFAVCCMILYSGLTVRCATFRTDGVRVTDYLFGLLPVHSRFVNSNRIHWFGVDGFMSSRTKVLKFAVSGERSWVVLASDVAEWEGARFMEFLSQHSFEYRTQPEP